MFFAIIVQRRNHAQEPRKTLNRPCALHYFKKELHWRPSGRLVLIQSTLSISIRELQSILKVHVSKQPRRRKAALSV